MERGGGCVCVCGGGNEREREEGGGRCSLVQCVCERLMTHEQANVSYLLGYWVTCQNIFVSLFCLGEEILQSHLICTYL